MKKIIITLAFAVAITSSCKHDHGAADKEAPSITITKPTQSDTISLAASGGKVSIKGTVTDNDDVHDVSIKVMNGSTNVFSKLIHAHAKSYTIDQSFNPTGITAPTALELTVVASDHNGNNAEKKQGFVVKP